MKTFNKFISTLLIIALGFYTSLPIRIVAEEIINETNIENEAPETSTMAEDNSTPSILDTAASENGEYSTDLEVSEASDQEVAPEPTPPLEKENTLDSLDISTSSIATFSGTTTNATTTDENTEIQAVLLELASSTQDMASSTATSSNSVISTGSSEIITDIANQVNTNTINSTGTIEFISEESVSGDLDLRNLFENFGSATPASSTATTSLATSTSASDRNASTTREVENTNIASTTNTLALGGLTGGNDIKLSTTGDAFIETGSSTVLANLVNMVNTNIIDSNYLVFFATIFGDLVGDILLPGAEFFSSLFQNFFSNGGEAILGSASTTIENNNLAEVENILDLEAATGENAITDAQNAEVNTGSSTVASNVSNFVNTNIIGTPSFYLALNVLGDWTGEILNLPAGLSAATTSSGAIIAFSPEFLSSLNFGWGCCGSASSSESILNNNTAYVSNDLSLLASTGENSITGGLNSRINTGNAEVMANVVNVVNTNVIKSSWLFGIISIIGDLLGDVVFDNPPSDGGNGGGNNGGGNGGGGNGGGNGGGGGGGGGTQPGISIDKTNSASGPVSVGEMVGFRLLVRNLSGEEVRSAELQDVLRGPDGAVVHTESWDLGTIAPEEDIIVTYDVIFSAQSLPGTYTNTALVTGTSTSGQGLHAEDTSTVTLNTDGGNGGGNGGGSGGSIPTGSVSSLNPQPASSGQVLGASIAQGSTGAEAGDFSPNFPPTGHEAEESRHSLPLWAVILGASFSLLIFLGAVQSVLNIKKEKPIT